jgi:mRNA interferase MazF
VVKKAYVPARGDIVWLYFDPQVDHEQSGRRPALVLSPGDYNRPSQLMLACPVTSKSKGYPFEVPIKQGKISGVILADQIKSFDWRERGAALIERASEAVVSEVIEKVATLLL